MPSLKSLWNNNRSACEILKVIYEDCKQKHPHLSLAWLANRLDLNSKSNISDFFNGRRSLAPQYWPPLFQALKISDPLEVKALTQLLSFEREKNLLKKQEFKHGFDSTLKLLRSKKLSELGSLTPYDAETICAFGMIDENADALQELQKVFPRRSPMNIKNTLDKLLKLNIVVKNDQDQLHLNHSDIYYPRNSEQDTVDYLLDCFKSGNDLYRKKLYQDHTFSYFESIAVSVNKKEYSKTLKKIKNFVNGLVEELETSDADEVVRLNFQIYPVE